MTTTNTTADMTATILDNAAPGSEFGILDKVGRDARRAFWTKGEDGTWSIVVPTHTFLGVMPETRPMTRVLAALQFAEKIGGASVAFDIR